MTSSRRWTKPSKTDGVTEESAGAFRPAEPTTSGSGSGEAPARVAPRRAGRPGVVGALGRIPTFEALRYREFRLIWLGWGGSGMATWMDQVSRGWLMYQLTDSALQLGLVRLIQAVPFFLMSPIAGALADRYDRKMQMAWAQTLDGVQYLALSLLIFSGHIAPWHVYATAFVSAAVQAFQQPPRQALVSDSVPIEHLTNAIGLTSIAWNVSRSLGPALAGTLIALWDTGASILAQAALLALATVWTLGLRSEGGVRRSRSMRRAPRLWQATSRCCDSSRAAQLCGPDCLS